MTWVSAAMSWKPKVALEPFIECAARKIALSDSPSGASRFIERSKDSMLARCSADSSKNTW